MKTFPLVFIFVLSTLFTQAGYADGSTQDALTEGQRDYIRGDIDGAKEQFKLVLEIDPNNMTARNYMRMIAATENASGRNSDLEKALTALMIPHVELKDATFDTTLQYLKQTAEKVDGGKTKVNFVVQIPDDVVARTKVTLNVSQVPFTEVMHYVSELTGFTFTIDKYAITVKQAAPPAPVASGTDAATPAPDNTTGMK